MENKKLAAAMAAVTAVITSEEQALIHSQAQESHAMKNSLSSVLPLNLWGLSGRQTIMQANSFIQQRLYR